MLYSIFIPITFNYSRVLIFLGIALSLAIILFILSILFSKTEVTTHKASPYECGFATFSDARGSYGVNFYVTGLLFMLFDLELILIIP